MLFYGPGESVGAFCFSGKKKARSGFRRSGHNQTPKEKCYYLQKLILRPPLRGGNDRTVGKMPFARRVSVVEGGKDADQRAGSIQDEYRL